MLIIVTASDDQWNELTADRTNIEWQRVDDSGDFNQHKNADAFFSLKESFDISDFTALEKPVFINSVINTLIDLKAPAHVLRINGWTTFLKRTVWEISGNVDEAVVSVFKALEIKINKFTDEPGFISARIIAMVINEAYFAVSENVSSKNEIDTAMKLGTNYPYGPFEWAGLIGKEHILALLQKLNMADTRYQPASLLIAEVNNKNK
jgi:3-hydroxybutyryl-CoA dehydrogenase